MGKIRKLETIEDFSRALKQGYGVGEGANYKPWLRIQDVKSQGGRSTVQGIKTGRQHHFLSTGESELFYLTEFCDSVIDVREQFPIFPITYTQKVAKLLGIKHPTHPISKQPIPITTDQLLTKRNSLKSEPNFHAISVKDESFLENERDGQKQDLERVCWELLGVPFNIYIGGGINAIKSNNIKWITSRLRDEKLSFTEEQISASLNLIRLGRIDLAALYTQFEYSGIAETADAGGLLQYLIFHKFIRVDLSCRIVENGFIYVVDILQTNEDRQHSAAS
ncbi:TnsA endonuclease N-terminal domain-containing protein [Planctobacterium marinum]|uniref:Transposase n=1 Tax=Planctobacterium marinum TaxID=1631968 RepID=A0AA48HNF4_9ALTE|nr:transposase [Planctobacterium marinum]